MNNWKSMEKSWKFLGPNMWEALSLTALLQVFFSFVLWYVAVWLVADPDCKCFTEMPSSLPLKLKRPLREIYCVWEWLQELLEFRSSFLAGSVHLAYWLISPIVCCNTSSAIPGQRKMTISGREGRRWKFSHVSQGFSTENMEMFISLCM